MGKTIEDVIIDKLDEIKELLEEIKTNTTPAPVFIPSIWPADDGGSDNWDGNGWWTITSDPNAGPVECCSAVADSEGKYTPNPNCGCSRCSDGTSIAGGCCICKCRNIAIYTEDGNWWCNKCYRERHMLDGSPRPNIL